MLAPSTILYATPARDSYPTDVDDATWELISPVLARQTTRGRPRVHADRLVYNAIVYVLRGGITWRMLPKSFPPWQTIYSRFRAWADDGTWPRLTDTLRERLRLELGRNPLPTAGVIDSQSVATGPGGGAVGYDAAKKMKGRKRHLGGRARHRLARPLPPSRSGLGGGPSWSACAFVHIAASNLMARRIARYQPT